MGLHKYEQERIEARRRNGLREDFGKKQEKCVVDGHLKKQLETAEQKLRSAKDAKLIKKLKEIISNIKSTLSK
ncbi:MAG: hypothetical protein J6R52_04750 [Alphaproteobacteria bacterium]|nr:hypothetical protein [Alphaproteobacteria bacterium]